MLSKSLMVPRLFLLAAVLRYWLAVCCLVGGVTLVFGGAYRVSTWGVDEGLPQSSVMWVAQTPDGYLWVATLMGSVSRFDGLRFINFDLEGAQPNELGKGNRIFTDSAGRLWVNPYNGLQQYRSGQFISELRNNLKLASVLASTSNRVVFLTANEQLLCGMMGTNGQWSWKFVSPTNATNNPEYAVDAAGRIWYLRSDCALGWWTDNGCYSVDCKAGLEGRQPTVLAADAQGCIWVGTDRGLAVWHQDSFQLMTPTNGEPASSPRNIFPASDGSLWVATDGRLRRFMKQTWVAEVVNFKRWQSSIRSVIADNQGGLWIRTWHSGLIHVDGEGRVERVTTADGLPSNVLRYLYLDREGSLWTGCDRGGLVQVRPCQFQTIGKAQGLADTVVSSVCEDREGTIWIGTVGGVLSRWRDGQCTNFTLPTQGRLCQNIVVCPDAAGRLWIGSEGNGVWVYENGEFKSKMPNLKQGSVRMILADRAGRIWVGTALSLHYYEHDCWTEVQHVSRAVDWNAALAESPDGTIWLGTEGGAVLRYNGHGFDAFQSSFNIPNIPTSGFWAMWPDTDGLLWIGTYGSGLFQFRQGVFRQFPLHPNRSWNRVTELLDDEEGNLWLGTRNGIERVAKSAIENLPPDEFKPYQHRIYSRADGLLTIGTSVEYQPRCWRGHDGRLWFGMANGVASVDPKSVQRDSVPPVMVIEEICVDNEVLQENTWRIKPKNLSGADNQCSGAIVMNPGQHDLQVRFTAPSMVAPSAERIDYRLTGLDQKWREAGTDRFVRYLALLPGKYTFQARAWNCDGVPSRSEATLAITVLPYFWQTRWFLLVLTLGLAALTGMSVALISRSRHRRRLLRLEAQRAIEQERTRIAQDIHDDLGASLTRITMLSQTALDKHPAAQEVNRIASTARTMTRMMDEIVWAINPRHDSLESLAAYFAEYVEEFLVGSTIKFRLEIPLDLPKCVINSQLRHNLFLAFKEALNNVAKHAKASEVVVTLAALPQKLQLIVADNGSGFVVPASVGKKINSDYHHGNGLLNMRHRLEELGGRFEITSVHGNGTRVIFEVKLPV